MFMPVTMALETPMVSGACLLKDQELNHITHEGFDLAVGSARFPRKYAPTLVQVWNHHALLRESMYIIQLERSLEKCKTRELDLTGQCCNRE